MGVATRAAGRVKKYQESPKLLWNYKLVLILPLKMNILLIPVKY